MKTDQPFITVDYWYDRSLRLWTCLWIDLEGNQYGAAQYAPNAKEKAALIRRMAKTEPCEYQI